jgi:hypothetical protein
MIYVFMLRGARTRYANNCCRYERGIANSALSVELWHGYGEYVDLLQRWTRTTTLSSLCFPFALVPSCDRTPV